ncbi:PhaM family polyhydroxyalkanoate granule multifunctional regulatory protein [Rhodoferax bucti]|uniref:PhaM family polyhydroxyalkanoate granule multifunctional regulatory protein n=1 Tax=Rhodoferax bucti TaxID=2576305 RepID=UPI001109BD6D|nr:PhaM family polyhydroxyalkanoate granule multifunctional regulatory protein [Rhodoferax bucti]
MSDSDSTGFGKFVPGFDFLQNLAKGASTSIPQMPNLGNWVAPTLNVEELDKRIEELKNVHFWLEQNSRALAATIQALEVQKMTLATLKGMNFNLGDMANALKLKATEAAATTAKSFSDAVAAKTEAPAEAKAPAKPAAPSAAAADKPATPMVDPLQLWGSLTQQFQNIAATALKEATTKTAVDITKNMATGLAKEAIKTATAATKKAVTKRAAPRKAAAKKTGGR